MMTASTPMTAERAASFLKTDYDLQLTFPRRPCLISELVVLPYGARDVIILGNDTRRFIQVNGSREDVLNFFDLLDGTRDINQLKAVVPAEQKKSFFEIQALLFRYGLLQDGATFPPEKGTELLASFLGRYVSKTKINRNRDEALQRLRRERLAVYAPSSVSEELNSALKSACLGAYMLLSDVNELAAFDASFVLVIADGSEKADQVLQFAYDGGIRHLMATVGETSARIGPLVFPKLTAGHECVALQLPPMKLSKDRNDLLFWIAYSLQETLRLLAGVAASSGYYNKAKLLSYGTVGMISTDQFVARVPGSKTSCLPDTRPLDTKSPAFKAWKLHSKTRLPPKEYVSPGDHEYHYAPQNLVAYQKPIPPEYGSTIHILPDAWHLPTAVPWLNTTLPAPAEFNQISVGNLLRIAVGHQKIQDQERRISPSGGGLKSAGFFIRTQSVVGVEDGWYSYNPTTHALEAIRNVDLDGIAAAFSPEGETQPLTIVVVSRLERARDKYMDFAYNLVHLDAGIATAFATLVADAFGWKVLHHPNTANASLAHSLGIDERDNYRIISNLFSIGKPRTDESPMSGYDEYLLEELVLAGRMIDPRSSSPGFENYSPLNWKEFAQRSSSRTFEEVLKSRRATYVYKDCAIKSGLAEDLVRIGHHAKQRIVDEGMFSIPFDIYILRAQADDGLASGAYKTNPGPTESWECITSPITANDLRRCLNQNSLSKAPLLFVMVANLNEIFHQYGAAGYRHLLNQCGFVVGQIWLAAHAAGLAGTACGGVLDEGMRNAIKADGYNKAAMIGFVVGEPDHEAKKDPWNGIFDDE